jgi:hypothetical protein
VRSRPSPARRHGPNRGGHGGPKRTPTILDVVPLPMRRVGCDDRREEPAHLTAADKRPSAARRDGTGRRHPHSALPRPRREIETRIELATAFVARASAGRKALTRMADSQPLSQPLQERAVALGRCWISDSPPSRSRCWARASRHVCGASELRPCRVARFSLFTAAASLDHAPRKEGAPRSSSREQRIVRAGWGRHQFRSFLLGSSRCPRLRTRRKECTESPSFSVWQPLSLSRGSCLFAGSRFASSSPFVLPERGRA